MKQIVPSTSNDKRYVGQSAGIANASDNKIEVVPKQSLLALPSEPDIAPRTPKNQQYTLPVTRKLDDIRLFDVNHQLSRPMYMIE